MRVICFQCSQPIAISAEVAEELRGQESVECPSCGAAVPLDFQETVLSEKQIGEGAPDGSLMDGLAPDELLARGVVSAPPPEKGWVPWEAEELRDEFEGRFHIERMLGRGGMGAVYLAQDRQLSRSVAIKMLPPELAKVGIALERFEREARAMAALDHPHIIKVHDSGRTAEGIPYFVMEYVEGMDLRAFQKSGNLSMSGVMDILVQVCDALEYAHGQGIVHRDIKPHNVLVSGSGFARVADFGLAKLMGTESRMEFEQSLTNAGDVMGTLDYMAPEQRNGDKVDHRVDIFALGVMLYDLLTGTPPQGAWEAPSKRLEIDGRLDRILHRALQPDLNDRYPDVATMKSDIEAVRQSTGGQSMETGHELGLPSEGEAGVEWESPMSCAGPVVAPEVEAGVSHSGSEMGRTLLILAGAAILVLGAVAIILAAKNAGLLSENRNDPPAPKEVVITVRNQDYTSTRRLIADFREEDLKMVGDFKARGRLAIGITRKAMSGDDALNFAKRTKGEVFRFPTTSEVVSEEAVNWLQVAFPETIEGKFWVQTDEGPVLFEGETVLSEPGEGGAYPVLFQWETESRKTGDEERSGEGKTEAE